MLIIDVTILILIDGFLQLIKHEKREKGVIGHNPYFNRWFSAIELEGDNRLPEGGHNPYFNRWFSAIIPFKYFNGANTESQSLF